MGTRGRRGDLHAPADQRRLDPAHPADRRSGQHDRVLDLAVLQQAARPDRGERPDVGASDLAVGPDDSRADDARALHAGAFLDHDPADQLAVRIDLAAAHGLGGLQHHPVDLEHVGDVAGVLPVPGDQARLDPLTGVDEHLDGLGNLQLAPPGRLELGDHVVHGRGEHVHADQREITLRLLGLLLQADDPALGVQLGDAELARVRDLGEHDLGGRPGLPEAVDQLGDAADDEVVAQVHDEVVVAQEVAGDLDGVRQPERGVLRYVGGLDAELGAVADGRHHLGRRVPDDEADIGDAGVGDGLQPVEQDRLVGHRHELLRRGIGDRPQPGTGTACQDECLHFSSLSRTNGLLDRPATQASRRQPRSRWRTTSSTGFAGQASVTSSPRSAGPA